MGFEPLLVIVLLYTAIAPWRWVWRFWLGVVLVSVALIAVIFKMTSASDHWGQGNIAIAGILAGLFMGPLVAILGIRLMWRCARSFVDRINRVSDNQAGDIDT